MSTVQIYVSVLWIASSEPADVSALLIHQPAPHRNDGGYAAVVANESEIPERTIV